MFCCRLFLCRIRSGHLASVLCNCYTGARPRAAAWCQYHHSALQYAIHTLVQLCKCGQLTDLSHFCYFNFPMNTTNERMITLCLVPHIVSPPHSTYPEVCSVTTEYLLPGLGWAGLGWAVVQIIQFSRSNPSTGLHGAGSCDGSRDRRIRALLCYGALWLDFYDMEKSINTSETQRF